MDMAAEKAIASKATRLGLVAKALQHNRLAHAYLITGPPGSGKRQFIEQCSQFLLCTKPVLGACPGPCHHCSSCLKFEREVHPDLLRLEPSGRYIKIDQVRGMQKMLSFAPLESKRRICTITSADRLNMDAANALLKTLEEPPENTHLLLSATSLSRLLPTIVSRCQVIAFKNEKDDAAHEYGFHLENVPGHVLPFLDYVSGQRTDFAKELIKSGIIEVRETIFEFLASPQKKELFFHTSQSISSPKENVDLAIKILLTVMRDLFLLKQPIHTSPRLMVNRDKSPELIKLAQTINYDSLSQYQESIEKATTYLDRNVNPEMISDMLLIFWLKAEIQKN